MSGVYITNFRTCLIFFQSNCGQRPSTFQDHHDHSFRLLARPRSTSNRVWWPRLQLVNLLPQLWAHATQCKVVVSIAETWAIAWTPVHNHEAFTAYFLKETMSLHMMTHLTPGITDSHYRVTLAIYLSSTPCSVVPKQRRSMTNETAFSFHMHCKRKGFQIHHRSRSIGEFHFKWHQY